MTIIEQVAAAMQDVLITIAQRLARETGFVQRESKLDGARFVQTLSLPIWLTLMRPLTT